MKITFFTSLLFLVMSLVSCHDVNVVNPHVESAKIDAPTVKNGHLVFSNYADFLILLRSSESNQNNIVSSWPTLNEFVSLERAQLNAREHLSKSSTNNYSRLVSETDSKPLSVSIPILSKIVNEQGIVVVENKLFSFSMDFVKILTEFHDSQKEIDLLLNSTESNESKGLYVKKVEVVSLSSSKEKGARAYNSFQLFEEGNTVPFYYQDSSGGTGFGITYGHVRGYVNGVRTNYPTNFCSGPNGTYVCGWDYSFTVHTNADFYLDEVGTTLNGVNSNISIVWNTDRGSGSSYGSGTICSSGSGMYGISGVASFSDVEGTVTFSIPVTVFNQVYTSTLTISI